VIAAKASPRFVNSPTCQELGTADAEAERLSAFTLWATEDVVQGMQQLAVVLKIAARFRTNWTRCLEGFTRLER